MFRGLVAQATVYRKAAVLGTEVLLSLSFVCLFFCGSSRQLMGKWATRRPVSQEDTPAEGVEVMCTHSEEVRVGGVDTSAVFLCPH